MAASKEIWDKGNVLKKIVRAFKLTSGYSWVFNIHLVLKFKYTKHLF